MAEKLPIFTCDLEDFYHAVYPAKKWNELESRFKEPTRFLLGLLEKHNIKAIFYVLGHLFQHHSDFVIKELEDRGHILGSHGFWHRHNECYGDPSDKVAKAWIGETPYYRSPYWDTTPMPWPPSGGFYFRFLPYWMVKRNLLESRQFWIHPHDLDEGHPRLMNPWFNWKRHINLKNARFKLERLLGEVKFGQPS